MEIARARRRPKTDIGTDNGKPAPRRRMQPNERREQILNEAIALFTEHGFEGTTRQLSDRIGVTQPLLYKYFPAKRDLVEAVYDRVYIGRLKPHWARLILDRKVPILERTTRFYLEYAEAILTREWVRLFVFAGLQGEDLNRRYLKQLGRTLIEPLRDEIAAAARRQHGAEARVPSLDDMWVHHGGIFYLGIREHIYGMGPPADGSQAIVDAVRRFLDSFDAK